MRPYYVISPEYESAAGSYEPPEPPEYGCDVVEVEARTRREAIALGVGELLKSRCRTWPKQNREDNRSPWTGMRAEVAVCGHGHPHFVLVGGSAVYLRCWACESFQKGEAR